MKINHYIFTEDEPIKIQLDFNCNSARLESKPITIDKLEKQLTTFLKDLQRYKQKFNEK